MVIKCASFAAPTSASINLYVRGHDVDVIVGRLLLILDVGMVAGRLLHLLIDVEIIVGRLPAVIVTSTFSPAVFSLLSVL